MFESSNCYVLQGRFFCIIVFIYYDKITRPMIRQKLKIKKNAPPIINILFIQIHIK